MDGFLGTFEQRVTGGSEDAVVGMWAFIIGEAFPGPEGYVAEPQYRNAGGFTDITTAHWRRDQNDKLRRTPFLVTQAKRAGRETGLAGWHEGELQLNRYLGAMVNQSSQLYGIVAIGKWAKFYKFNKRSGYVEFLKRYEKPLHVKEKVTLIRRRLEWMKSNH